mmetsp:Transcript_23036/g.22406  ORF Transcript_23036/g.22406 Transcript_23036/m.22406 type:complete len:185 (+) Transcript_23036:2933-3487(+)
MLLLHLPFLVHVGVVVLMRVLVLVRLLVHVLVIVVAVVVVVVVVEAVLVLHSPVAHLFVLVAELIPVLLVAFILPVLLLPMLLVVMMAPREVLLTLHVVPPPLVIHPLVLLKPSVEPLIPVPLVVIARAFSFVAVTLVIGLATLRIVLFMAVRVSFSLLLFLLNNQRVHVVTPFVVGVSLGGVR